MKTVTLKTTEGATTINYHEFKDADVLIVCLEGTQYDTVYTTPVGRQAWHKSTTGDIVFPVAVKKNAILTILKN